MWGGGGGGKDKEKLQTSLSSGETAIHQMTTPMYNYPLSTKLTHPLLYV